MSNIILDPHGEALMKQFRELRPTLETISDKAYDILARALKDQEIYVTAIEHRIKTEKSLAGKLGSMPSAITLCISSVG